MPWLNTIDPYLAAAVHQAGRYDLGIRTGTGELADRLARARLVLIVLPGTDEPPER